MGYRFYGRSAEGDEFNPFCIKECDNTVKDVEVMGIWFDIEQTRSSTWREQNSYKKLYSDN